MSNSGHMGDADAKSNESKYCKHGVTFDEAAARGLAPLVVKRRWPRARFTAESPCLDCGFVGVAYASVAHYRAGDW